MEEGEPIVYETLSMGDSTGGSTPGVNGDDSGIHFADEANYAGYQN